MKKKLFSDIQKMSIQEINQAIVQNRRRLFQMRVQTNADGFKSSDISLARKEIARFKTALTEKSRDGGSKK